MFDTLKLRIECWHYSRYAKANKKRKLVERGSRKENLYDKLDDIRRKIGYIR